MWRKVIETKWAIIICWYAAGAVRWAASGTWHNVREVPSKLNGVVEISALQPSHNLTSFAPTKQVWNKLTRHHTHFKRKY